MREIKFRSWNIKNGSWDFDIDDLPVCDINYMQSKEIIILEQFTGLRDKNGKDIYEGDIYICDNSEPQIISFEESYDGDGRPFNGFMVYGVYSRSDENIDIEVIGNIHENPELIDD